MAPTSQKSDHRPQQKKNDSNSITAPAKKEILCDGWYYDVTDFARRHPGGSIIEYYTKNNEDATLAIQQFHQRSTARVKAILKSFKRRPATDADINPDPEKAKRHRAMTEDFTKLYLELEKEGMFKPSYIHHVYRIVELFGIAYIGYLLLFSQSYMIKLLGCALIGLAQGRSGWVQHESGHHSMTGNPKVDRILHALLFGVCLGLSSTWWRRGHNRHHAMPQRLKHDVDLDTLPLLVYNVQVVKNPKQGKNFIVQNQKYLFLLVDTLIGTLTWQLYLHPKYALRHGYYLQLVSMAVHYVGVYYIGFWAWLVSTWLMSIYLFGNFALSHSHLPVTNEPTHWLEYGLLHTADVEQSPWCDWWMGYLNYQIEHHLFPTMPQFRHPKIHHRVRALAEKHGIPYYVLSYKEALYKTFKNLEEVAEELKHMQA
ncbi:Fatty acid desaturase 2 [Orchesella cincta]|uniref:Fatty acid desaturase 2 n=1 Tax=Orchesella cincta TaxID=48709 RepID=A0A1D2MIW2_ORCCI|nr:Fatty acid desaturase 2 [Orchesella cincta]